MRPGKFNHRTYNLAWGHRMCNTIQEDMSLEETLKLLDNIVGNNKNRVNKNDIIEEQKNKFYYEFKYFKLRQEPGT